MKLHQLALLVGAFLSPIATVTAACGFLVMLDLFTGMWASWKRGQRITSDRFGKTLSKTIVYLLAILAAFVAETFVLGGVLPLVKVVSGLIASTELLSAYENLSSISGVDFAKRMTSWLRPTQPDKENRG